MAWSGRGYRGGYLAVLLAPENVIKLASRFKFQSIKRYIAFEKRCQGGF
jgi:hypothetical protein